MVHVRFITGRGKKGIGMYEAGAWSRSPIMSNQASRCEDKAALTTYAHSEFHLTSQIREKRDSMGLSKALLGALEHKKDQAEPKQHNRL